MHCWEKRRSIYYGYYWACKKFTKLSEKQCTFGSILNGLPMSFLSIDM